MADSRLLPAASISAQGRITRTSRPKPARKPRAVEEDGAGAGCRRDTHISDPAHPPRATLGELCFSRHLARWPKGPADARHDPRASSDTRPAEAGDTLVQLGRQHTFDDDTTDVYAMLLSVLAYAQRSLDE
jgi:hypothetical protein